MRYIGLNVDFWIKRFKFSWKLDNKEIYESLVAIHTMVDNHITSPSWQAYNLGLLLFFALSYSSVIREL